MRCIDNVAMLNYRTSGKARKGTCSTISAAASGKARKGTCSTISAAASGKARKGTCSTISAAASGKARKGHAPLSVLQLGERQERDMLNYQCCS